MSIQLIGVDCATQPKKTGLARGWWDGACCIVEDVQLGSAETPPAAVISGWMQERPFPTLLAIDAPLGWPLPLSDALHTHRAGDPLPLTPNALFRRETDVVIKRELGKQPLDVGADRIARTAHVALRLLQTVRDHTEAAVPLAWEPGSPVQSAAIEVYPAGTLIAHGIASRGYKKPDAVEKRASILAHLPEYLTPPQDTSVLLATDDALDALLCVLAGIDFLRGEVIRPTPTPRIHREGWIWVKSAD